VAGDSVKTVRSRSAPAWVRVPAPPIAKTFFLHPFCIMWCKKLFQFSNSLLFLFLLNSGHLMYNLGYYKSFHRQRYLSSKHICVLPIFTGILLPTKQWVRRRTKAVIKCLIPEHLANVTVHKQSIAVALAGPNSSSTCSPVGLSLSHPLRFVWSE
jgi:hypothetical protein